MTSTSATSAIEAGLDAVRAVLAAGDGAYTAGRGFATVADTVASLATHCTVRVLSDGCYLIKDGYILSYHSASSEFWLAVARDAVEISNGTATFLLFPEFSIGLEPFLLQATCAARRDGLNIHLAEAVVPLRDWPVPPDAPPASSACDELWPDWRGFLSSARAGPA